MIFSSLYLSLPLLIKSESNRNGESFWRFSYKYNTAERGGCSSVFFFKVHVLELGKVSKRVSSMSGLNSELISVLLTIVTLLE